MPKGVPKLGSRISEMAPAIQPEVIGFIPSDHKVLDPTPQGSDAQWETEDGHTVDLQEEAPPWEKEDSGFEESDARRFVDVPTTWTLRWINPKLLESQGWRYWRPVMKSDPRVKVKVDQMVAPDGNIRRGGAIGDILAYMPTTWVESRRKQLLDQTKRQSQSAVDKQRELEDELRRMSPYFHLEGAKHPRYTGAEGRSMTD